MNQKARKPLGKPKKNINFDRLPDAIFVVSQKALGLKFQVMINKTKVNNEQLTTAEIEALESDNAVKMAEYRKIQTQRLIVLRHLILKKKAALMNYVVVKGIAYGHLNFGEHKFFVSVNKKIINFYKLEKVGDSFPDMPYFDLTALQNQYMPIKKAQTIFGNYLKIASDENKKNEKHRADSAAAALEKKKEKESILSVSSSETGNIVVVKKRSKV